MRHTLLGGQAPLRCDLARVARLTGVGKSTGHQLVSLADITTEVRTSPSRRTSDGTPTFPKQQQQQQQQKQAARSGPYMQYISVMLKKKKEKACISPIYYNQNNQAQKRCYFSYHSNQKPR